MASFEITRPAAEAKRDEYKHIVTTRNGHFMLGGMHVWADDKEGWDTTRIDFSGSCGDYLNAGATIPTAWLDLLCVAWVQQRNLAPQQRITELEEQLATCKLDQARAEFLAVCRTHDLEKEQADSQAAMAELAELNFNLAGDGPNARYVYDLQQSRASCWLSPSGCATSSPTTAPAMPSTSGSGLSAC